jgi:membrane-associated phospholipid phosphatase
MDPTVPVAACVKSLWASLFPCYHNVTFGSVIMIIYSLIPVILPILLLVKLCWRRDTSSLLGIGFLGLIMLFSEGILKHLVKQTRPIGSCDCSYGMPSSHSATSYGFLVWIYLEVGFPIAGFEKLNGARGWSNPQYRRVVYLVTSTVSFVPVPFSRVYFLYHSVAQVLVGIIVGSILALGWFGFLRGLIVPKSWLDKLVLLRPFRLIRAINDYRPRPIQYSNSSMAELEAWETRSAEP